MNWLKNIRNKIKEGFHGLMFGLKAADDAILHSDNSAMEGVSHIKEVDENRVSKALLKGEITHAVEELRYRTYKVDKEAKQYEYYAPTLAFKRDKQDSKFVKYENADKLEVITIQPNIEYDNDNLSNIPVNEGDVCELYKIIKLKKEHVIKIYREGFYPRYRIEEYTTRLVVRKADDTHAILDFYVSQYPNEHDYKSKGFIKELEKIRDNRIKSDVIDISRVGFVTSHAYKLDNMLEFEFDNLFFREIVQYDGCLIIRFKARITKNGVDLTDKFYCKSMDEKYKNKVKKNTVYDIDGDPETRVYKCEKCGKEIIYDPTAIDKVAIEKPREIDEEATNTNNVTEYMDVQIMEQTYGVILCAECLKKFLQNNNLNTNN